MSLFPRRVYYVVANVSVPRQSPLHSVTTAGIRYLQATNAVSRHSATPVPSQDSNHARDCVTTHRTTRHMPDAAPASRPKMLSLSFRVERSGPCAVDGKDAFGPASYCCHDDINAKDNRDPCWPFPTAA